MKLTKVEIAHAWREHAERLRAAIMWAEPPFVGTETSEEELRQRVKFMIQDAERSDAILKQRLGAPS